MMKGVKEAVEAFREKMKKNFVNGNLAGNKPVARSFIEDKVARSFGGDSGHTATAFSERRLKEFRRYGRFNR